MMELRRATIRPEWLDYNGHMNVTYYLYLFDQSVEVLFDLFGIGETYRKATGGSFFAADHHISYKAEVKLGEEVRLVGHLVDFDAKRVLYSQRMIRASDGVEAAAIGALALHVDLPTRRVKAMDAVTLARLGEIRAAHADIHRPDEIDRGVALKSRGRWSPASGAP